MDNSFNLGEIAASAINALKGLDTEQLMTVGIVAYFFGMYKVNETKAKASQLSDNRDQLSRNDIIDVPVVSESN